MAKPTIQRAETGAPVRLYVSVRTTPPPKRADGYTFRRRARFYLALWSYLYIHVGDSGEFTVSSGRLSNFFDRAPATMHTYMTRLQTRGVVCWHRRAEVYTGVLYQLSSAAQLA